MLPDLERLIRLQRLEDFVAGARRTLAEHPDRLEALDDRLAGAREAVAQARQRAADIQAARRLLDKDLAAVQGRLSKFKDQLMEVKTNREYQAMQKEIEVGQHEVGRIEDKILERMLEADEVASEIKRSEADLVKAQAEVEAERRKMEEDAARLQENLEASAGERQEIVAGLGPSVLAMFDQIMRQRKGTAVAEARDGHCTVCYVRLRPQMSNEIRRNDALIQCPSCQRILYFAGEEARTGSDRES
jgi:predicted  nucleic acid-binding Zn-ribbon protein